MYNYSIDMVNGGLLTVRYESQDAVLAFISTSKLLTFTNPKIHITETSMCEAEIVMSYVAAQEEAVVRLNIVGDESTLVELVNFLTSTSIIKNFNSTFQTSLDEPESVTFDFPDISEELRFKDKSLNFLFK